MSLFDLPPKPEPRFWKWLTYLGAVLFFGSLILFALLFFWPVEGDRPFDSGVWKENSNTLEMNVRTSMRKDLAVRIKAERWTPERVRSELGEADIHKSEERLTYSLGRRRGAWPFRRFGFLTSFDPWIFHIYFNEHGVAIHADAGNS